MADWRTDDRELLARILMAEAGNQGPTGMTAVGNVIMNRANTTGYGDGIRGVIMKPGQFSPMNSVTGYANGEQGQNIDSLRPNATNYMVADALLSGNAGDITGGATHFFNPDISNPSWAEGKDFTRIGDHVFGSADAGRGGKQSMPGRASTQGAGTMKQEEQQSRGLLSALGIQKMQEGAAGETGQRLYERGTFKDTAAVLAQGFAAMGTSPALQKMTADIASQRNEAKARNKTVEYLRANGRGDLADMIEKGMISGKDAAGLMLAKPAAGEIREVDGRLVRVMPDNTVVELTGGGSQKAPKVTTITRSDGSQVAVQWDETSGQWIPLSAPEGAIPIPTKLTEGQAKTTLFSSMQSQTAPVLDEIEQQWNPANIQDAAARATPIAGNYFTSPEGQIYQASAEAWAEGALRIATGAAATPAEKEAVIKTYFAQPGDTPGTITFKNNLRKAYEEAINASLGQPTGYKLPVPQSFGGRAPTVLPDATAAVGDINSILGD